MVIFLPQHFNDDCAGTYNLKEILSIAEAMYRQIKASTAIVPHSILELLGLPLPLPKEESFEMVDTKEESFEMVKSWARVLGLITFFPLPTSWWCPFLWQWGKHIIFIFPDLYFWPAVLMTAICIFGLWRLESWPHCA